jgi:hypothetical protein
MSEFFLQIAVTRLSSALGWGVQSSTFPRELRTWLGAKEALTDEDVDRLTPLVREQLRPMGFLPWRELSAERVFLGGDDVIVVCDPQRDARPRLGFRSRSPEALANLGQRLGIDLLARATPPAPDS